MLNVTVRTTEPGGSIDAVLKRIRREVLEMSGSRLPCAQARPPWNWDAVVCESLCTIVVDLRSALRRTRDVLFRSTEMVSRRCGSIA
jgi:hypothetical protein